jgi:putative hydrolase of HD superfamily
MPINAQHLIDLYQKLLPLKLLPRTGWLQHGVAQPESIADHSFGVAVLAFMVADQIEALDHRRLLALAVVHDLAEALVTDLPSTAKRLLGAEAKQAAEQTAITELFAGFPQANQTLVLWQEYTQQSSREARLIKALDRLELLAQTLAYEQAGNRNLGTFWQGAEQGWEEFPLIAAMAAELVARRG